MTEADLINHTIRSSTGAWFETYGRIFGKDRSIGVFKPTQNHLQRKIQAVIDKMEELGLPIRIMGLKPRQKGSTTYFSAAVYTWLRRRAASAIVIGGQFSQVKEAWEMLQTYQKNDKFNWGNQGEINSKTGSWSHGSKLIGETAKDVLAGIGGTHQVLHCFEVARWGEHGVSNTADVLVNITKSVPDHPATMIIMESTAEGATGEFYSRYVRAVDAEDFLEDRATVQPGQYVRLFSPWFEFSDSATRLSDEQKLHIQMTLDGEDEYKGEKELIEVYGRDDNGTIRLGGSVQDFDAWEQLAWRRVAIAESCKRDVNLFERDFPKSWRTAFQKSGNMRFNQAGLAALRLKAERSPPPAHGVMEETKDRRFVFRKTEKGEATTIIFEKPIQGCRYILSADPMTGETQVGGADPDRHGVFVLRAGYWGADGRWNKMKVAARLIQNRWDIDVVTENAWGLARHYGNSSGCKIAIEMNQDRGMTELLKKKGADLYQREIFNQREQRKTKAYGYQTTEKTRENLIETLAKLIREHDKPGDGIDLSCLQAIEQCENFIRKPSGRSEHADGWHDDDVLGIALGAELIEHATTYVPPRHGYGLPPDLREPRPQAIGGAFS